MNPLFGPPPAEIPLPRAPLVRVLTQLRFAPILLLQKEENIAPFQELVRSAYPAFVQETSANMQLGPVAVQGHTVWRFSDRSGSDWRWRLSLSVDFLSLETCDYTSRADFVKRLGEAVGALQELTRNPLFQRLGVRYLDRVDGEHVKQIAGMVQPPMIGVVGDEHLQPHVRQALSQAMYQCAEGQLLARWGLLPPKATHDPSIMAASESEAWILDLDVFEDFPDGLQLDAGDLVQRAERLAERAYAYFRYTVNEEFLRAYGGQV